jgi:outer membrane protein OmpA-like peptidoglycan-associated protein
MLKRPNAKARGTLASLLVASGVVLSIGAGTAGAAERPTEADILNALRPAAKTRALTGAAATQQTIEEQRFIDSLRTIRTRSLTTDERRKVAEVAKDKPTIDLEIYFTYNSAEIARRALPDLMNLGRALTAPDLRGSVFLLSGHTDAKGGDDYNLRLSERRAQSVKRFLMQRFRMPDDSLVAAGYGEERLKNTAEPFAAENRRVQITNLEAKQKAER